MKKDKNDVLKDIKDLEAKLALLTIELEDIINKDQDGNRETAEPKASDVRVGHKVKILTTGAIPFDLLKSYTAVKVTPKRVKVKVECGTLTRAPPSLKKID